MRILLELNVDGIYCAQRNKYLFPMAKIFQMNKTKRQLNSEKNAKAFKDISIALYNVLMQCFFFFFDTNITVGGNWNFFGR